MGKVSARYPGKQLQLFLALDLLAFGGLLELGIDLRPLGLLQLQLRKPALVVDRDGRTVYYSPLDVVDADVVVEDGARVGIGLFNGCAAVDMPGSAAAVESW